MEQSGSLTTGIRDDHSLRANRSKTSRWPLPRKPKTRHLVRQGSAYSGSVVWTRLKRRLDGGFCFQSRYAFRAWSLICGQLSVRDQKIFRHIGIHCVARPMLRTRPAWISSRTFSASWASWLCRSERRVPSLLIVGVLQDECGNSILASGVSFVTSASFAPKSVLWRDAFCVQNRNFWSQKITSK
jgi:hypothetical protein